MFWQNYFISLQPASIEYSLYYNYFFQQQNRDMLINELSKRTGVSIHTLRYYENYGLIAGRTDKTVKSNNYKQYDEILVEKINWIVESKKAGFTLAEIRKSLDDWFNNKLSANEKIEIVQEKIKAIDTKIRELKKVRKFLVGAIKDVENEEC